jgi:2-oxoglutarate ferredoxin oxidoreductase subunit delta
VNNINLEVNMASGKPIIAVEKCKGCGLCIRACPKNLLEMSKDTNGQGVHYPVCNDESKCIACTFCATMCPDVVIEIEKDA